MKISSKTAYLLLCYIALTQPFFQRSQSVRPIMIFFICQQFIPKPIFAQPPSYPMPNLFTRCISRLQDGRIESQNTRVYYYYLHSLIGNLSTSVYRLRSLPPFEAYSPSQGNIVLETFLDRVLKSVRILTGQLWCRRTNDHRRARPTGTGTQQQDSRPHHSTARP